MRKLVYAINVTADGCCDHTKGSGTAAVLDHYRNLFQQVDLQIFGRKTYELMVPYWPDAATSLTEDPATVAFGKAFVALDRAVVSRTLTSAAEPNTTILRGDLKNEVLKLKQTRGRKILVGGVSVPAQLMEMGLVDEMHLVVQPFLGGEGKRLSFNLPEMQALKLVSSEVFGEGMVALHYARQ